MSTDEFIYPADDVTEPLVADPVVDARYSDYEFDEDHTVIYDTENPDAWIEVSNNVLITFGGDA